MAASCCADRADCAVHAVAGVTGGVVAGVVAGVVLKELRVLLLACAEPAVLLLCLQSREGARCGAEGWGP